MAEHINISFTVNVELPVSYAEKLRKAGDSVSVTNLVKFTNSDEVTVTTMSSPSTVTTTTISPDSFTKIIQQLPDFLKKMIPADFEKRSLDEQKDTFVTIINTYPQMKTAMSQQLIDDICGHFKCAPSELGLPGAPPGDKPMVTSTPAVTVTTGSAGTGGRKAPKIRDDSLDDASATTEASPTSGAKLVSGLPPVTPAFDMSQMAQQMGPMMEMFKGLMGGMQGGSTAGGATAAATKNVSEDTPVNVSSTASVSASENTASVSASESTASTESTAVSGSAKTISKKVKK
jgi:hypothetical protein